MKCYFLSNSDRVHGIPIIKCKSCKFADIVLICTKCYIRGPLFEIPCTDGTWAYSWHIEYIAQHMTSLELLL